MIEKIFITTVILIVLILIIFGFYLCTREEELETFDVLSDEEICILLREAYFSEEDIQNHMISTNRKYHEPTKGK